MDPSELRHLAMDYARGRLTLEEYRRRRASLIDRIVEGTVAIERNVSSEEAETVRRGAKPPTSNRATGRSSGVHKSALASLAVAAVVAWALWSALRPAPAPEESALPRLPVPVRQVSEARGLVETFLATRRWDERHVAQFERQWEALGSEEQAKARNAPWFPRLIAALNDELEARTTADGASVRQDARAGVERLLELAANLGVAGSLSSKTPSASEPAPTHAPETEHAPVSDAEPVTTSPN